MSRLNICREENKQLFTLLFFLLIIVKLIIILTLRKASLPEIYNTFKQNIPLLALGLLFQNRLFKTKILNISVLSFTGLTFIYQILSGSGLRSRIYGLYWQYHALYLYTGLFFLFQILLRRKGFESSKSFLISLLLTQMVGLLYEVPIYYLMNPYVGIWFHYTFPFIINGCWIVLFGLLYWFKTRASFHFRFYHLIGLSCWFMFSVFYAFNPYVLPAFIPRIPTSLLMIGLCVGLGIKSNTRRKKVYNMEFDEVVKNSNSISELNLNIRTYLTERNLQNTKEGSKHYWAIIYAWKRSLKT